ncbi:tRNA-specific adenosine deaminase 1-like isoform X1 [Hylaeus volcanicus]|uniref:tRNA-specific adenosine deaminase 1-like isoform X1 n=2 Tax=Hylaeus volcanicus TaxID=313075 RepID=UPI0023B846BE|nr:tRNA-specific adenosine deaminase 1-like isoform X1 [Hylaeus volcanicus]
MEDFADEIAKLCIDKYIKLGKSGKPTETEWTVLSGIVLRKGDGLLSLVALATGTKCLGEIDLINTELYKDGCRLNDSHAEVLARRAFLRYLYEQINLLLDGTKSDVFTMDDKKKLKLNNGISFHFFTSQTPCGDCSIFPKDEFCENDTPPMKIRKHDYDDAGEVIMESYNDKKEQIIKDIYRTGAKCVKTEQYQDPHLGGVNYHVIGPLRTKPGRGNPTLSLSCSDKMAKWNILGLQGSLLSILIPSIKMETITVGGKCPFSLEAMERGLHKRFNNKETPGLKIMQAKFSFQQQKNHKRKYPCPSSIIWCAVRYRNTEIAVEGRKQGATKKKKGYNLLVTRRALFETFLHTYNRYINVDCNIRHPKKITYLDYKKWSKNYQNLWNILKSESFRAWPAKPTRLQTFVL